MHLMVHQATLTLLGQLRQYTLDIFVDDDTLFSTQANMHS